MNEPLKLVCRLVPRESVEVVFDVGAAEGRLTQRFLALFRNATVYAFEPTPGACKLRQTPRFVWTEAAVLDKSGVTWLNVNTKAHTNSVLPFVSTFDDYQTLETVQVPTITLDRFCAEHEIDSIDVLKLDVQGAELRALQGAKQLLAGGAIRVIIAELQVARVYVGQCQRDEVIRFLARYGLDMKGEFPYHRAGKLVHYDGVFAR